MTRAGVLVVVLALLVTVSTVGSAQAPPGPHQLVEAFIAAVAAGDAGGARGLLADSVTWAEYDLYWRVATTRLEVAQRVHALVANGVRIEAEVVAVMAGGSLVIVHERTWGDTVPEAMAPLRSTTTYLVEAGQVVDITRVLASEQRDELAREAIVGVWTRRGAFVRHDSDGTFRTFADHDDLIADVPHDSGTYTVAGGIFTYVSDDASTYCEPGDRSPMRLQMIDADTVYVDPQREQSECVRRRHSTYAVPGYYTRVVDD